MKNIYLLISLLFLFSCGNEKVVQLPEINHSNISEIQDVSAAYLFYDASNQEGYELNRKNLISSTNWLVNVDKRLTLKQVIPQIKFLQNKKQTSSHKNENAKNYFTCNDISKKTLGFIEFTDVIYEKYGVVNILADQITNNDKNSLVVHITRLDDIKINVLFDPHIAHTNIHNMMEDILSITKGQNYSLTLSFNEDLLFQEYIQIKSIATILESKNISISKTEFMS